MNYSIIVYASEWSSTKRLASSMAEELAMQINLTRDSEYSFSDATRILQCKSFDDIGGWLYDRLGSEVHTTLLLLIATATEGTLTGKNGDALQELRSYAFDHRIGSFEESNISYTVIGYGDTRFGGKFFCSPAIEINHLLKKIGLTRNHRLLTVDSSNPKKTHHEYGKIKEQFKLACSETKSVDSEIDSDDTEIDDDLEEVLDSRPLSNEMITPTQRTVLTKQGYRIIGSHSAIKLCRWTKHQLRGKGGCYKHTFYGIQSHRCMEFTCCLSCANQCLFCWRHHQNPVSKKWSWKMDEPREIVDAALREQHKMVNIFKGAPGVAETGRLQEAFDVAHCALSLVGEPILFPRVNEVLLCLHERNVSTFLVNNGQFPDQISALTPVTQLYLSVDASDPDTMKYLDRPLFDDFWERFMMSVENLKDRPERTIFRLTMVKDRNADDALGYAKLIPIGVPDFIEIKGVTFSGKGCGINMCNVPTHEEVVEFSQFLLDEYNYMRTVDPSLPEYEIALEHEHSCSVLIAHKKYYYNNGWNTWIDYSKFFQWAKDVNGNSSGVDYSARTPDWALFGGQEKGFDPADKRKYSKGRLALLAEAERVKNTCTGCNCM